jgi:hypothetical protein
VGDVDASTGARMRKDWGCLEEVEFQVESQLLVEGAWHARCAQIRDKNDFSQYSDVQKLGE